MRRRKKKRTLAQKRKAQREASKRFVRRHRELVRKRKKISDRKYYLKHRKEIRKNQKIYNKKYNKRPNVKKAKAEYARKRNKKWGKKIRKKTRKYMKKYLKVYRSKHSSRISRLKKIHYRKNKPWIRIRCRKYMARKRHTDINFKLVCILRQRLSSAIRHNLKTGSAVKDLGCSIDFLKEYLKKKFNSRMTWKNHGVYWEIDHIKALSKFDLSKRSQLLKAVHYTNLQPLTKAAHRKKTAKERSEKALDNSR